ncbi:MAG: replicative DNA helicase [Bacteroidetes bacterium]|nr:MAG: replicative DNA helicase [Bacteroidota bacterium]RLD85937.1 MAG: replicative DNA helicase [Bacteroidota bacterium]
MATKKKPQFKEKVENSELGKIPPQALELEEAVLGAIMLEKNAALEILDLLIPESFYMEAHQKIFRAISDLSVEYKPVDMLTVTEELRKKNELDEVGGAYYVSKLTSNIGSAVHLEFHARIIAQKYIQRELIRVASDIQKQAYDDGIDILDLLNYSESSIFQLAEGNIKSETVKISQVLNTAIERIEEASKREDNLSGEPSGFTSLDRITSGWQPSDLVIIAARPSMGKTALVLSMARNMAVNHKIPIVIFSLEMSVLQLVNRLIAAETELPSEKLRSGRLEEFEWQQLEMKIKNLNDAPIYIDDTPAITLFELRAKCRRLKTQNDIKMIIIDYLQLMSGTPETKGNREQEVSTISRGLKAIAKELDVPIIALSQLNRSVEMRSGDKRPQLSDLRESGAIEQDADLVIFIHRPEKYGITEDGEGNSTKGLAELIIAKHRNGAIADVQLKFREELAKFEEFEASELVPLGTDDYATMGGMVLGSKMNDDLKSKEQTDDFSGFAANDEDTPF